MEQQFGKNIRVLVAGRSKDDIEIIDELLAQMDEVTVEHKLITNGHADPLHGVTEQPDVLVYRQSENWMSELAEFSSRAEAQRPVLLVIGDAQPETMRAAMKAGACDYISDNASGDELKAAIRQVNEDILRSRRQEHCNTIVVMNSRGGCGASLIAANIAHHLQAGMGQQAALIDLELQLGSPGPYMDQLPKRGLIEALQVVDQLDTVAVEGYVQKHSSGLHILSAEPEEIVIADEQAAERFGQLFQLLGNKYEQLVFDIPRHIDLINSQVLQHADQVLIVTEQNLNYVRDANRLLSVLYDQLHIEPDKIQILVNRYDKNAVITLDDIKRTLQVVDLVTIPNDYKLVSESINSGTPVSTDFPKSAWARAVNRLTESISQIHLPEQQSGLMGRMKVLFKGA